MSQRILIYKHFYPNNDILISQECYKISRNQLKEEAINQLLAHFNHSVHSFNAHIIDGVWPGDKHIQSHGKFPFIVYDIDTWSRISTIRHKKLFKTIEETFFREPTTVNATIKFNCLNPDPKELCDILDYIGYIMDFKYFYQGHSGGGGTEQRCYHETGIIESIIDGLSYPDVY